MYITLTSQFVSTYNWQHSPYYAVQLTGGVAYYSNVTLTLTALGQNSQQHMATNTEPNINTSRF